MSVGAHALRGGGRRKQRSRVVGAAEVGFGAQRLGVTCENPGVVFRVGAVSLQLKTAYVRRRVKGWRQWVHMSRGERSNLKGQGRRAFGKEASMGEGVFSGGRCGV